MTKLTAEQVEQLITDKATLEAELTKAEADLVVGKDALATAKASYDKQLEGMIAKEHLPEIVAMGMDRGLDAKLVSEMVLTGSLDKAKVMAFDAGEEAVATQSVPKDEIPSAEAKAKADFEAQCAERGIVIVGA